MKRKYIGLTLQEIVEQVLVEKPETRDSDFELYRIVSRRIAPLIKGVSFDEVLSRANDYGIPPFESVRRVRQKLQQYNPLLRASIEVQDMRYENWKEVMDYVSQ